MKKTTSKVKVKAPIAVAGLSAKKHGELLFEIGCEEIPAGMIQKAASELKALLHAKLVEHGLLDAASAAESDRKSVV